MLECRYAKLRPLTRPASVLCPLALTSLGPTPPARPEDSDPISSSPCSRTSPTRCPRTTESTSPRVSPSEVSSLAAIAHTPTSTDHHSSSLFWFVQACSSSTLRATSDSRRSTTSPSDDPSPRPSDSSRVRPTPAVLFPLRGSHMLTFRSRFRSYSPPVLRGERRGLPCRLVAREPRVDQAGPQGIARVLLKGRVKRIAPPLPPNLTQRSTRYSEER